LIIQVARLDRNFWKYARHRKAYKAVLLDAGHLSQTLYLTATSLGVGAFFTAAINDAEIEARLKLRPLHDAAVAINGVGIPDSGNDALRFVAEKYEPMDKYRRA
jgi:SagB-type dehydrogenase family enzyme